jgi:polyisoprenoid-binding protein YceI
MNKQEMMCYEIEPADGARFAFEVVKTGLMRGKKHIFEFDRYLGEIRFGSSLVELSEIGLTIDADSLTLHDNWIRRGDQRRVLSMAKKKMLAVSKFPEIKFRSSQVSPLPDDRFNVAGELVIRGVARPTSLTLVIEPAGSGQVRLAGQAEIHLRDFGLKPPTILFGVVGTRNEIAVAFTLIGDLVH